MADAIPTVRLAATLLHFAWQGLALALVAWALMTLVRSATARYGIGCAALVAMLIAPIVTFLLLTPAQSDRHAALLADHPASATAMTPTPAATALPPTVKPPPPAWHERLAPIAPFAVAAWLAGVAAIGMRHALGLAGVARLRRNAMPVTDDVLLARLAHLSARLGIRRRVMLLNTVDLDAPAVIGWLRPAILWPASLMSGLTPAQLDGLLAHELAHVRRHDYLVNLLQSLVETLLFYHPAVWWLSRRIRQEREHCCDDIAARAIGDRAGYAEALVALEWSRSASPLVLASNGGTLMTRVERLVAPVSAGRPAWFGAGALFATIVLVIAAVLWTQGTRIAAARAGDEQAAKGPTTAPTTGAPTTQRGDYVITSGDLVRVTVMDLTISASFLPHDDPDACLAFYRDVLGFEVRNDVGQGTMRWITVGPVGQPGTSVVLAPPAVGPGIADDERRTIHEMMAKGSYAMLLLSTPDLDATFDALQASAAEVVQEPTEQPYGVRDCAVRDPAGTLIRINEVR